MAKLIAQSGHSIDLPQRRMTLGESPSCDIPLAPGLGLAPIHFEVVPGENGAWFIRDLSQGGLLLVNGVAIREGILAHGNVIVAGSLQLGFWNAAATVAESQSPFLSATIAAAAHSGSPAETMSTILPVAPPATAAAPATEQHRARADSPTLLFAPPEATPPTPASMAVPSVLNPSVAGMAPSSAPLESDMPPLAAAGASAKPGHQELAGPPIAWLDLNEEKNAALRSAGAASSLTSDTSPAASGEAAPLPVVKLRRWRGFRPGPLSRIPRPVAALLALGLCGLTGLGLVRIPQVNAALQPLMARFHAWTNPELPAKPASAQASATEKAIPVIEDPGITPRAGHNDVVKVFLNERVSNLFQADLKQLIPFYNSNSTASDFPPQKEITEAFRKHYGVLLDGFDRLSCLRTPVRDEFVFVLSGGSRVDLEGMIGLPPQQKQATTRPRAAKSTRVYPVKAGGRVHGIAQYDPFTVVLGNAGWIDTAINGATSGLALREALCMMPESASRGPGALIMVERLPSAKPDSGLVNPFEVAISNLHLKATGDSRLILTRNPEVKEEIFVEQSSAALKRQTAAMFQALHIANPRVRTPVSQNVNAVDPDEIITTSEASIKIVDGEELIREALETVARTFTSQSPAIDLILAAQTAVLRFNQARLQGAAEATAASSVAEAIELLQNGIAIKGKGSVRDVEIRIERMEPEQIELVAHLLHLDSRLGLVYRPDKEALSGSLLELALKARDFRNAELLISLWSAGNFSAGDAADTRSAVRRILDWANKDGHRKRVSVGLPMLTDLELSGATEMLTFDSGSLKWKAGTEDYRSWLRKVRPDPRTDAKRIASAFSEAKNAGAIPNGSITQLSEAIHLINRGVRAGENSMIRAGGFTQEELRAAARYLQWDSGHLKVLER